jgi:site-specific recombinase XerD
MKLSEAIKQFISLREAKGPRARKTAARYLSVLRPFCLCMHDPDIEELDVEHVQWYLNEMERLGWKPNGRNLAALGLKKLFEYCNLRGYPVFNEQLIPVPERETNIPRVTDLKTFQKLLAQIPGKSNRPNHIRNRALVNLLWDTGARNGEICSLNTADLEFKKDDSGSAVIKTEKSRGRRPIRQIFWTPKTGKALKEWIKKKTELQKQFTFADPEALFVTILKCPQAPIRGRRMVNRSVCEVMRVLSNQAGLPTVVNAHTARHAMGRDAAKALRSDTAVANILGHSNVESSYIYTMVWGDDLKEEWQEVMRRRGVPIGRPPQISSRFPKPRQSRLDTLPGRLRPTEVATSRYGRMAK